MSSPFPGMDPYIEDPEIWGDFHAALATEIRTQLNKVIQPRYVARLIPHTTYTELLRVEIHKTGTLELVTAIEILSSVNKQPSNEAYIDYLRKRREILRSAAHLLEIDLLRGGERPPIQGAIPLAPYYVGLSRVEQRPAVEVWPIQLWDELPVLPVPLHPPDADVQINLATALDLLYKQGGYASLIDYHRPPPGPKLTKEQNLWLDDYLHKQGIR